MPKPRRNPQAIFWVNIISVSAAIGVYFLFSGTAAQQSQQSQQIPPDKLEELINQGVVKELVVHPESFHIRAILDKGFADTRLSGTLHLEEVRKLAKEKKVVLKVAESADQSIGVILIRGFFDLAFPILLFVGFIYYMRRMQGGGDRLGFVKSPAKTFEINDPDRKTFADVAGCDEAKEELQEVAAFLKNPDKFTKLGAKIPKGVMLYGEPGNGKTLLAKAVAGEANVPFLFLSGSDFIEMFVGVGASRVRNLFVEAKKRAPCILFIDEIDALAKSRGKAIGGGHDEREQALNALLAEMDGFTPRAGIIVMAATNRLDVLDTALLRPGRFDRHIYVTLSDLDGREQILKVHAKDKPLSADVDLREVAKSGVGMSGAELANMLNEAALLAARKDKKFVGQDDIDLARDKVTMGPEKKSRRLSEKDKRIVAYHEAGHAVVATLWPDNDPVHKITIVPRGPGLGYVIQLPQDDRYLRSRKQILAEVAVLLGGRASEELKFQDVTSGAANDLERATGILRKMIYELGMDPEVGLSVFRSGTDFWGQSTGVDASQKTKELLEKRIKATLDEIYGKVRKLLADQNEKLEALVAQLLEKETLTGDEVRAILNSVSNPA